MDTTGCITWPKTGDARWTNTRHGLTSVWAYWLVDHRREGLELFDQDAPGLDWFLVDGVANLQGPPTITTGWHPSPNHYLVDGSAGVLGAVCLGTADATWWSHDDQGYFWASSVELTRPGRNALASLSSVYGRDPVLVTYMWVRPMRETVPEATHDQATVVVASGHA